MAVMRGRVSVRVAMSMCRCVSVNMLDWGEGMVGCWRAGRRSAVVRLFVSSMPTVEVIVVNGKYLETVEVETRASTEALTVLSYGYSTLLTKGYARNNSSVAPVGRGGIPAKKVGVPRKRRVRGN
jgi:hypothetical protein